MSDTALPLAFYVIPQGCSQGDPLAQDPPTLGLKIQVGDQQYGALLEQSFLERLGLRITRAYGTDARKGDVALSLLIEGGAPPSRVR